MVDTGPILQMLWKGKCTVKVRQSRINPITKRTEFDEVTTYTDEPCKLSFETISSTDENSNAASITQKAKLFIGPDVIIPPGSKITVTQNGRTVDYEQTGEPAVYTNHQEIILNLFKEWS